MEGKRTVVAMALVVTALQETSIEMQGVALAIGSRYSMEVGTLHGGRELSRHLSQELRPG